MERKRAIRGLAAVAVAGAGLAVALLLGAPWPAALLALMAGLVAVALLPASDSQPTVGPAPAGDPEDPRLPAWPNSCARSTSRC